MRFIRRRSDNEIVPIRSGSSSEIKSRECSHRIRCRCEYFTLRDSVSFASVLNFISFLTISIIFSTLAIIGFSFLFIARRMFGVYNTRSMAQTLKPKRDSHKRDDDARAREKKQKKANFATYRAPHRRLSRKGLAIRILTVILSRI